MKKPRKQRRHAGSVHNYLIPVTSAALTLTICIGVMTPGTYAWFTSNITSAASSIQSANFTVDVKCTDFQAAIGTSQTMGAYSPSGSLVAGTPLSHNCMYTAKQAGTYTFELTASGSASKGYCQVDASWMEDGTKQIGSAKTSVFGKDKPIELCVTVPAGCTLTFTPVWTDVDAVAKTTTAPMAFAAVKVVSYAESLGLDMDTIFGMPADGVVGKSSTITTLMPSDAQLSGLRQTAMLEVPSGYQFYGWAIQAEFGYSVSVPNASLEETLREVYDSLDGEPYTLILRAIYTPTPEQEPIEPEQTVPETTVPEETVPETTVPETTVPETTVPETTVPETTVPETTEVTEPETTATTETTSPEDTESETEQTEKQDDETQGIENQQPENQKTEEENNPNISLSTFSLNGRVRSSASAMPTVQPTTVSTVATTATETTVITEETEETETTQTTEEPTQPQETEPIQTEPEETEPTAPAVVSKVADAATVPLTSDQIRQRVLVLLSPAPEETEEADGPSGTNGVPLYFQNDYPYTMYGDGTIATSGCGITALAMVATYMTGHEYLPDELAGYFGGRAENNMARLVTGSETLQLPFEQAENWDIAYQALKDGKLVILMVDYLSKFTDTQHFLVLTGLTEEGKILVNDPNRDNYDKWDLKNGFENGFTAGELLQGWSGAWVYDPSAMPEVPFIYYEEPVQRPEMRYPDILLTQDEIELLAKVVWVEAQGECAEGQQAVAEVALNRLASENFPNNLHDVIYGENQFRSVPKLDDATPWQAQYEAIENAIYGPYVLPEDVVYFATTPTNDNVWGQIGGHIFCYGN